MITVFSLQLLMSQYHIHLIISSWKFIFQWNTSVTSNGCIHKIAYIFLQSSADGKARRDRQLSVRDALNSKKEEPQKDSEAGNNNMARLDSSDDDEADFDSRMRMQILKKRKELGDLPPKPKLRNGTLNCLPYYRLYMIYYII